MMIKELLLVGSGGFIGAVLRYLIINMIARNSSFFALGTLVVNVLGSFIIGILVVLSNKGILPTELRLLLVAGLLGSLTTYSTFAIESVLLFEQDLAKGLVNIALNNALAIFAAWAGYIATKNMI